MLQSEINWASIIDAARTGIRAAGFGLGKIVDSEAARLVAKIKTDNIPVVLTLNDPASPTASMRVQDEQDEPAALRAIAEATIRLLTYKDQLPPGKSELLTVRQVSAYPTIAVVVVDQDLYAYWYSYGRRGSTSPVLVFHDYDREPFAQFFVEHLEALERIAHEPDLQKLSEVAAPPG